MVFIIHLGGTRSLPNAREEEKTLAWQNSVTALSAIYISGVNWWADFLSQQHIDLVKWSLQQKCVKTRITGEGCQMCTSRFNNKLDVSRFQRSSGRSSGGSGHSMGSIQPDLCLTPSETSSSSIPQDQDEEHSSDLHSSELAQIDVVLQPDQSSGRHPKGSSRLTWPFISRTGLPPCFMGTDFNDILYF